MSSEKAELDCYRLRISKTLAMKVANLVMQTDYKNPPGANTFTDKLIQDLDFAVVASQHRSELFEYEKNIRAEYPWCSDIEYAEGRKAFLQRMIERGERNELYLTDFFRDKFTSMAVGNMKILIDSL